MTPAEAKEVRDALIAVERWFQKETGADCAGQLKLWDQQYDTWKAVERAKRIMDRGPRA